MFGHHYKMTSIIRDTELKSTFFPADQINRSSRRLKVSLEVTSARKNGARDAVAPITSRDTFKRLPRRLDQPLFGHFQPDQLAVISILITEQHL